MGAGAFQSRRRVERRLFEVHERLRRAREELEVIETQLSALTEQAEEARVRMLVAETPAADRDWREAQGHAQRLARSAERAREEIGSLETAQDDLLGQLVV